MTEMDRDLFDNLIKRSSSPEDVAERIRQRFTSVDLVRVHARNIIIRVVPGRWIHVHPEKEWAESRERIAAYVRQHGA